MSVKNIFFTDDNQLDFKIGDEDVSKIFCGDVLVWERGEDYGNKDRIEYVKGFTSPVNGVLKNTSYESSDVNDICEVATDYTVYGNPQTYIKPKEDALCLLFLCATASSYPGLYNALVRQGWELIDSVGLTNSKNEEADISHYSQVYQKRSNGGIVGVSWDRNVYNSRAATIVCLYGATSVTNVQSGNMELNTHYWNDGLTDVVYAASGYTLPATTGKYRVIGCSNAIIGPYERLSSTPFTSVGGEPDIYLPTISVDQESRTTVTSVYFDMNSSNGLYFYGYASSSDIDPSTYNIYDYIGRKQMGCHVFDVNYD